MTVHSPEYAFDTECKGGRQIGMLAVGLLAQARVLTSELTSVCIVSNTDLKIRTTETVFS